MRKNLLTQLVKIQIEIQIEKWYNKDRSRKEIKTMKKYGVFFEEKFEGKWMEDHFTLSGEGFSWDEAQYIANDIKAHGIDGIPARNIKIIEIKERR